MKKVDAIKCLAKDLEAIEQRELVDQLVECLLKSKYAVTGHVAYGINDKKDLGKSASEQGDGGADGVIHGQDKRPAEMSDHPSPLLFHRKCAFIIVFLVAAILRLVFFTKPPVDRPLANVGQTQSQLDALKEYSLSGERKRQ